MDISQYAVECKKMTNLSKKGLNIARILTRVMYVKSTSMIIQSATIIIRAPKLCIKTKMESSKLVKAVFFLSTVTNLREVLENLRQIIFAFGVKRSLRVIKHL